MVNLAFSRTHLPFELRILDAARQVRERLHCGILAACFALCAAAAAVAAPTVAITGSPRQVLAPGQNLNVAVTASGSGALTYQWIFKGKPIAGATGSSY